MDIIQIARDASFVLAITQLLKNTFNIPSRFKPLTAIGVGIGLIAGLASQLSFPIIVEGTLYGLLAVGAYTGTKEIKK